MKVRTIRRTLTVLVAVLSLTSLAGLITAEPAAAASLPAVSKVVPASGSTAGGTRVTVYGARFTHVRAIKFGAAYGRSIQVVSSTKLLVTTPPHAATFLHLQVLTSAGISPQTNVDRYRYVHPPVITGLSSHSGPAFGGVRLTVVGTGFTGTTHVAFGTVAGAALRVISATQLQITTPPHAAGPVQVRITNRYGTSATTTPAAYRYVAAIHGPAYARPGSAMTITGRGFKPGTPVHLALPATSSDFGTVTAASDGSISKQALVPAGVPDGQYDLAAVGTDSTGTAVDPAAALTIDSVAPVIDTVDLSTASTTVGTHLVMTAHATDTSGVVVMNLQVHPYAGVGSLGLCPNSPAQLISGTPQDGIWSRTCDITATTLDGTYQVEPWGSDLAGNYVNINGGPAAPEPTFTVSGAVDPGATPPPVIMSVTPSLDSVTSGTTLAFDAHVTSGVGVASVDLQAGLDGGVGVQVICDNRATLVSGTALDGVWRLECTVPTPVLSGTYSVTPYAQDVVGQSVNTGGPYLSSTRGTFTVTGGYVYGDTARPRVASLTVSPSAAHAGDTLTLTAHVTSPIGVKNFDFSSSADGVTGNASFCHGPGTLTAGTVTDGDWTFTCAVPSTVASASYTITTYSEDLLGQYVNVNGGPSDPLTASFTVS